MPKFLTLWEVDNSQMPTDPNEIGALLGKQIEITKKMLDEGQIKDWGIFAGGDAGYAIGDGTEDEMLKLTMPFMPFIKFHIHPIVSIDKVAEMIKSMTP